VTTSIGLISDVHACPAPLEEALEIFRRERVDMVICAGDIAGYGRGPVPTVELLRQSGCVSILGNHDIWYLDNPPEKRLNQVGDYLSQLHCFWESVLEGVHVYAVHASPPESLGRGIRLLDDRGEMIPGERDCWEKELGGYSFDVLVVGHTHQVFAERLGGKLVVNPGSTKFNHTCAVLDLPGMEVRVFPLGGREPVKAWNWGMMVQGK